MKNKAPLLAAILLSLFMQAGPAMAADAAISAAPLSKLQAVPFTAVRLADEFWGPRIALDQSVTIPDMLDHAAEQGKIDAFLIVAGKKPGTIRLASSPDSDVYKLLEAASYTLAWRADPNLDRRVDEIVAIIAGAQEPDGYINTTYMLPGSRYTSVPGRIKRGDFGLAWKWRGDIAEWPRGLGQLYSAGHMFEAAAAHYRATGKRNFLDVAIKLADCVAKRFPLDKPVDYADHPQAGLGLVKLYEVTGDKRYLDLARHIVSNGKHARPVDIGGGESYKPLAQQRKAYGHAVRTAYLYSAATDLCRHLESPDLREAIMSLWPSIVDKRMYVTGGVGNGTPREQHGEDYDLPNDECYCECCANIALAQWSHRMNLLTGESRYADIVELVAYNSGLSGISLDGRKFFYTNLLQAGTNGRKDPHSGLRTRYLFCCPSKLPGFLPGVARWMYATDSDGLCVNLYAKSTATLRAAGGDIVIRQQANYPWDGAIKITLEPGKARELTLRLRIPAWCGEKPAPSELYSFGPAEKPEPVTARVNGKAVGGAIAAGTYLAISRLWKDGDVVELNLPMPARRIYAIDKVAEDRGRVALMRGPMVYCAEAADNKSSVLKMVLPADAAITCEHRPDLLGGVTVLKAKAVAGDRTPVDMTAVPYYAWQNRGVGEMAVWLIENPSRIYIRPKPVRPGQAATKPATKPTTAPATAPAEPSMPDG